MRGLLRDEAADFEGAHFDLHDARCEPKPVQAELPIWIGGGGEHRTLRIAARHADGWNVPFMSPEEFARKRAVLAEHCAAAGRDPADIRFAVNVGRLRRRRIARRRSSAALAELVRPGVLGPGRGRSTDAMARYVEAGADQVNLALERRGTRRPRRGAASPPALTLVPTSPPAPDLPTPASTS